MAEIILVEPSGATRTLPGKNGMSVMEIIRDAGVDQLLALCGGCCSCATCHVHVEGGPVEALPPISADEDDLLASSDQRTAASRLSCQLPFSDKLDGLRVKVIEES